MDTQLEYRGFHGSASYNPLTGQHYGLILGVTDRVRYEAIDLDGLVANFEAAVDEYTELIDTMGEDFLETYRQEVSEISVLVQSTASEVSPSRGI